MNDAEKLELPHILAEGEVPLSDSLAGGYYDRSGNRISFRDYARLFAYDRQIGHKYKQVARDEVGDYLVSTVWLGANHSFHAGPPLIFETMVFKNDGSPFHDLAMERYSSEAEALAGHARFLEEVKLIVEATR